jgi:AcrR family transcriptional regulator
MAKKSLAPRQARSRETERRLVQAVLHVLSTHGLEGATIPRIAAQAGLTPGAVYRRFPDKSALLETVMLTALESNLEYVKRALPAMAAGQPLPALLDTLIGAMIQDLRTHASLLRSVRQLVLTSEHPAFRRKVCRLENLGHEHLIDLLLTYRREIRHPDPQRALAIALTSLRYTLIELFLVDAQLGHWPSYVPKDDTTLRQELKRMFLRQLGHTDA